MKKVLVIFALFSFQIGFGQKIELALSSGYAVSTTNSYLGQQQIDPFNTDIALSNIKGTMGSGLLLGFSCGINLRESIKLGLSYESFLGNHLMTSNFENTSAYLRSFARSTQQRILPSITFKAPFKKLMFYAEVALIVPMKTLTKLETEDTGINGPNTASSKSEELSYQFSFGYHNALGCQLKLNESWKFNLQFESNFLSMSFKAKTTKSYSENGIDKLSTLSTYQKETLYFEDLNNFSNTAELNSLYTEQEPRDELARSANFSSLAFRIAICYQFRSKKE